MNNFISQTTCKLFKDKECFSLHFDLPQPKAPLSRVQLLSKYLVNEWYPRGKINLNVRFMDTRSKIHGNRNTWCCKLKILRFSNLSDALDREQFSSSDCDQYMERMLDFWVRLFFYKMFAVLWKISKQICEFSLLKLVKKDRLDWVSWPKSGNSLIFPRNFRVQTHPFLSQQDAGDFILFAIRGDNQTSLMCVLTHPLVTASGLVNSTETRRAPDRTCLAHVKQDASKNFINILVGYVGMILPAFSSKQTSQHSFITPCQPLLIIRNQL